MRPKDVLYLELSKLLEGALSWGLDSALNGRDTAKRVFNLF